MIEVNDICQKYGQHVALDHVSFSIQKGEVVGLLGPNGAGKSTTMKILTCYLPPSSGQASIAGISLDQDTISLRRNIGYLPENAPLYTELDVQSHLRFMGRMHGLSSATLRDKIAEMAQACGLSEVLKRRIDELSKGFRQRVGLAASMLHDPPCLILDEPTTGLDPNQIVEIRHLIQKLGEKKTVLLSSHVLSEVEAVCQRMLIIDQGKLIASGSVQELAQQAQSGQQVDVTFKGDASQVLAALRAQFSDSRLSSHEEGDETHVSLHCLNTQIALSELVFQAAVKNDAVIVALHRQQASLEDVFRKLTGGEA
ncbi:MAG: ATP-binding cassette domain-containing protein [Mariprofundaceae bacterium]|nr:ATP-binding cassette domain-containing protein [Mariprofundaceae bacterium]